MSILIELLISFILNYLLGDEVDVGFKRHFYHEIMSFLFLFLLLLLKIFIQFFILSPYCLTIIYPLSCWYHLFWAETGTPSFFTLISSVFPLKAAASFLLISSFDIKVYCLSPSDHIFTGWLYLSQIDFICLIFLCLLKNIFLFSSSNYETLYLDFEFR